MCASNIIIFGQKVENEEIEDDEEKQNLRCMQNERRCNNVLTIDIKTHIWLYLTSKQNVPILSEETYLYVIVSF